MKKIVLTVVSAILLSVVYAFNHPQADYKANLNLEEGIAFHKGTLNEALQLAQKENKLVFVYIYTSWCGYCKRMKANTFTNAEVIKLYNQNFINIALDGEQAEGSQLMQKYNFRGFPSFLFLDGSGNMVSKTSGYHKPEEFIGLAKTLIKK